MKSKEVLSILKISRVTLCTYVRLGYLKVTKLQNGYYDYDENSVHAMRGKNDRYNVIYARVSTYKQRADLKRQIESVQKFCNKKKIDVREVYSEISSGIDIERPKFNNLLQLVFDNKIKNIYVSHKDRLSRLSFITLRNICTKFGTKIIVINETESDYDNEVFDELISLMKKYSHKRKIN